MNGTIDHRPDRPKPWRARSIGPDGKQKSRSHRTKSEAQRWLRAEISNMDRGTWVDPAGGTVQYGNYAEGWIEGLVGLRTKTLHGYRGLLQSRVLPTFANHELRRITPAAVRSWISSMDDEGLSPSRIRQAVQVLRASLDQAVDDGLIGRNPAEGAKIPRDQHREMRFLTADQVRVLAQAADRAQPGAGTMVTFAAWTGLRWSEIVGLRRSDLDLLRHQIHVREAVTEVNGKLIAGRPKNHQIRTLIVPSGIAELVAAQLDPGRADDLVFPAPRGGHLRSANFRSKVWLAAVAELASRYPDLTGLRFHDLRHTAASLAISTGANIKAIQRMLGHKNASMTLDRYGHLFIEDLSDLADRLDEKYRGAA